MEGAECIAGPGLPHFLGFGPGLGVETRRPDPNLGQNMAWKGPGRAEKSQTVFCLRARTFVPLELLTSNFRHLTALFKRFVNMYNTAFPYLSPRRLHSPPKSKNPLLPPNKAPFPPAPQFYSHISYSHCVPAGYHLRGRYLLGQVPNGCAVPSCGVECREGEPRPQGPKPGNPERDTASFFQG